MSSYIQPQVKTFCADADLAQYTFVKLGSSDKHVANSGAGEKSFGVNMTKDVKSGDACEIAHLGGGALIKLAGTITRGDSVKSNANGEGVVAAAVEFSSAVAMESGVAGDVISVILDAHVAF